MAYEDPASTGPGRASLVRGLGLTAATVGIAFGHNSDVTVEAGK